MNMHEAALNSAQSQGLYLIVAGLPGDGSIFKILQALAHQNKPVHRFDFHRKTTVQVIKDCFDKAAQAQSGVLISGFEDIEKHLRADTISALEKCVEQGLSATLSIKQSMEGIDFGKAFLLVNQAVAEPASISNALAKRRLEVGGLPQAEAKPTTAPNK